LSVGIIDNQKDTHYQPAPYTDFESDDEDIKEQSLFIDYKNLQSGHTGLVEQEFKNQPFRDITSLLRYNKIRFWMYAEKPANSTDIYTEPDTLIIRIGADSLIYYEIAYPFMMNEYTTKMNKNNWKQLEIDFSDLTKLKTMPNDSVYTKGNYTFRIMGDPTLSFIDMIYLGMKANNEFSGRLYFDDIRVAEP